MKQLSLFPKEFEIGDKVVAPKSLYFPSRGVVLSVEHDVALNRTTILVKFQHGTQCSFPPHALQHI